MKTEIIVITDRSGSMRDLANEVIGGYNKFLEDQRKVPGEARVTFTQFDNEYEIVYSGVPLVSAPALDHETYQPRGTTALHDAIGRTLETQGRRIAADQWAELVIVCVITDGYENASREYTKDQIQAMTAHAEAHGWKFVYLAANQNAVHTAKNLGMQRAYASNFAATGVGTQAAYVSMSATSASLRSGIDPNVKSWPDATASIPDPAKTPA
jgi:Mg-chelatase subunit ChlD